MNFQDPAKCRKLSFPGHFIYNRAAMADYPFHPLPRAPQERCLDERRNLKDLSPEELVGFLAELGEPRFRAKQIFAWVYGRGVSDFQEMTDLSKKLRLLLEERACLPSLECRRISESESGDATKYLFDLPRGGEVETVVMRYPNEGGQPRIAVCVSSQVGCAMGCTFCASGVMGLKRHLSTWEIVDQVVQVQNALRPTGERVSNVVFMGLGEPLHNYEEVLRAVRLLHLQEGLGIGMRHLTISTSGLVPQLKRLGEEGLPISLAISLHAVRDELRSEIMPVNRRWNISELLQACKDYSDKTRRRITFEYILLDGINDSPEEAERLGHLLTSYEVPSLVNLIPWNPVSGVPYRRSTPEAIRAFQKIVEGHGVRCTVRREKGGDIDAACGQLRLRDQLERGLASREPG